MGPLAMLKQYEDDTPADTATPVRRVYRFAEFELTTSPLRLDRDGVRVDVRPQSLRVLERLLTDVGSVVSADELVPGSDESSGRARVAVVHLRKVLGDRSGSPLFVETVRSRGYRFVHPVEVVEEPMVRWRSARTR